MPTRLSRRKYAKLSKFLTETFTDPKMSIRVRMTAALRLADILAAHDANNAAKEIAAARAAARVAEATAPQPAEPDEGEPANAEAQAIAFLYSMKQKERKEKDEQD